MPGRLWLVQRQRERPDAVRLRNLHPDSEGGRRCLYLLREGVAVRHAHLSGLLPARLSQPARGAGRSAAQVVRRRRDPQRSTLSGRADRFCPARLRLALLADEILRSPPEHRLHELHANAPWITTLIYPSVAVPDSYYI